jgi:hypothetical protein
MFILITMSELCKFFLKWCNIRFLKQKHLCSVIIYINNFKNKENEKHSFNSRCIIIWKHHDIM